MYVNIRRIIRRDFPEVLAIENDLFEFPWTENEFVETFAPHDGEVDAYGVVAEHNERIVGYMVFDIEMHIWLIAVHRDFQRQGIGRQLIDHLKSKNEFSPITLEVRETNLEAQFFFSKLGFKAKLLPGFYPDLSEDAYSMTYQPEVLVKNRISQHSME